jgi:hypothetical protein
MKNDLKESITQKSFEQYKIEIKAQSTVFGGVEIIHSPECFNEVPD